MPLHELPITCQFFLRRIILCFPYTNKNSYVMGSSPRTHERCDLVKWYNWRVFAVSIHAPTKGATFKLVCNLHEDKFQSTHPRKVRQNIGSIIVAVSLVSIHAPTKGATRLREVVLRLVEVSIHAPTKGATQLLCMEIISNLFQSTHPRKVRPMMVSLINMMYYVSIHAPTKGATEKCNRNCN